MDKLSKTSLYEASITGVIGSSTSFAGLILFIIGLTIGLFVKRIIAGYTILFSVMLIIVGLMITYIAVSNLSKRIGNDLIRKFYLRYVALRIIALILFIAFLYIVSRINIFELLEKGGTGILLLVISLPIGIVSYAITIISMVELRNSYDLIKSTTGNELFSITALTYSIGAVLQIIIIGFIILLITPILEAVSWKTLCEYSSIKQ